MIIHAWNRNGELVEIEQPENPEDLKKFKGLIWIHLEGDVETKEYHLELMRDKFDIPALSVQDALRTRHPPKFESLGKKGNFLLLKGLRHDSTDISFNTIQLALFWSENRLITRASDASASAAKVMQKLESGELDAPNDIGELIYRIVRAMYDRYLPILFAVEARLEEIEDLLLKKPTDELLAELMEYSRQLKKLRRIANYHTTCIKDLMHDESASKEIDQLELTDLFEQAERQTSLSELLYDVTSDLINGYISITSHRLNNIMRTLTIVTVLFVPLTFIAGIYGMNFEYIPELKVRWGYFAVWGTMISIALGLLTYFRYKKWI